jgi:DNA-directed RNA polymerase alpha subunit
VATSDFESLGTRICARLSNVGITKLEQLIGLDDHTLFEFRGIGIKSARAIIKFAKESGVMIPLHCVRISGRT